MKRSWKLMASTLFVAAVCSLGAVGQGQDIVVALGGDVEGWDPATEVYYAAGEIVRNCYDSLLNYEIIPAAESGYGVAMGNSSALTGELAESWEISEDGTVYTFHLRPGVVFVSGNTLSAEDVRWSVERAFEIPGSVSWLWGMIGVLSATQVHVIDDLTVEFVLESPNPIFLPALALEVLSILDSEEMKKHVTPEDPYGNAYLYTNIVSTGAYNLESYNTGTSITLKANPNYWAGKPQIDTVTYQIVPSEATRILLLKSGDVDFALFISAEQVEKQLIGAEGVRVVSIPTPGTQWVVFNTTRAPLDNVLVRRALAYATPYDALVENVLFGHGSEATSPLPSQTMWHRDIGTYTYDITMARELLTLAGYPDGLDLTISYRLDNPAEEAVVIYLQDAWADAGVNVTIDKVAAGRFSEMRSAQDYQIAMIYGIPYVNHPVYHLGLFWDASCCNFSLYESQDFQLMLDAVYRETDLVKQKGLVNTIEQIIMEASPMLFLYHPNRITCMRDDVQGFVYYNDHLMRYDLMYKD